MVVCSIFIFFSFARCFCDYGGVHCCEVGVVVLFCNGAWVCADVCCVCPKEESQWCLHPCPITRVA